MAVWLKGELYLHCEHSLHIDSVCWGWLGRDPMQITGREAKAPNHTCNLLPEAEDFRPYGENHPRHGT